MMLAAGLPFATSLAIARRANLSVFAWPASCKRRRDHAAASGRDRVGMARGGWNAWFADLNPRVLRRTLVGDADGATLGAPRRLGRYELVRLLARGGMA